MIVFVLGPGNSLAGAGTSAANQANLYLQLIQCIIIIKMLFFLPSFSYNLQKVFRKSMLFSCESQPPLVNINIIAAIRDDHNDFLSQR